VALREFAAEVRRHDPHRIILTGNSHSRASAWHNTHENSWKQDSKDQGREVLLRDNPAPVDSISIHLYGDAPVQKELAGWTSSLHEYLEWIMGVAREHRRPVFIGEFGLSSEKKTPAEVRAIYEQLIDAMETARVDLAAFWVFDLPAQSSTGWNVNFENDRAYMLDLALQAHKRWNAAAGRP
jgi:hypothetical protein